MPPSHVVDVDPQMAPKARTGSGATPDLIRGVGVVTVSGRLDADSLTGCRRAMDAVLRRGVRQVILDLGHLTEVAGVVHVLDLLRRHAERHGSVLVVADPSAIVREALFHPGASARFLIASTLSEALAGRIEGPVPTRAVAEEHDERQCLGNEPAGLVTRADRTDQPPWFTVRQRSALDAVPQVHVADEVRRERLMESLSGLDDDVALVFLAAGAGYGKTTVARQWADQGAHACIWLEVGGAYRGPPRLARELARALVPGPAQDVPSDQVAERLSAAVRGIGERVVLVLEDVHLLPTGSERQLVTELAERLPRGSRIVATARSRTALATARLNAQGRLVVLGPQELALSRAEVAVFSDLAGLRLPPDALDEMFRRTEGWPAGLHLAAASLGRRSDAAAAVWTLGGDDQAFVDYFRQELLSGLSAGAVRFLMRSAVLDRMSTSLCDAALDIRGSAAWLAELAAAGVPVVPLDDQGQWCRYSRLFGEMLRGELRRRQPGEDRRVITRAAQWYEEQGMPEEAIGCAVAAGANITASRLIVANTHQLNSRGRIQRVREWIDAMDEGALELYPPLATAAAWVFALTGDAAQARRALGVAESAAFAGPIPDGSSSFSSAVALAKAALAPDGVDAMLPQAREAVRLEPPGSAWHTVAALLLGMAEWLAGSPRDAAASFERAFRYERPESRPGAVAALGESALLAAGRHDWRTAEWCVREAQTLMQPDGMEFSLPGLVVTLASGRVALHRGDTQQAMTETRRAIELYEDPSPNAWPWLAVQASVELGRLLLGLEDVSAAEIKVIEARRHLRALATAGLLTTWVDQLAEDVDHAKQRTRPRNDRGLTKAELRVLQFLPTHLLLGQIADELIVARNTVKSQVASIYLKLGATNRAEAVERARECGLLAAESASH